VRALVEKETHLCDERHRSAGQFGGQTHEFGAVPRGRARDGTRCEATQSAAVAPVAVAGHAFGVSELPTGTVTFVFTDIEGSTRLAQQVGDAFPELLQEHHRCVREAIAAHGGHEVDTAGDGFFIAFARARDAIDMAVAVQRALATARWQGGAAVRVRIGIHTGEAAISDGTYIGLAVHRAARIGAAGHGGQVLVSPATSALLEDADLGEVQFVDLGEHPLKDFDRPVRLYQLRAPGLTETFPALRVAVPGTKADRARIQLCGRFVVRIDGERLDEAIGGGRRRLLFAFLALNRERPLNRAEIADAVCGSGGAASLTRHLSALRAALGSDVVRGKTEIELVLPSPCFVDAEAAVAAVHRAESAVARREWAETWGPAGVAMQVGERTFLPGLDAPWIEEWRRRLEDVRVRGLESFARAALELGGPALPIGQNAASLLTQLAPQRESGYELLMKLNAERGQVVEAVRVFEDYRSRLKAELGLEPGPALSELRRRLAGAETATS
jgi:SARP family transcriptional regulator, regulator of embCAB operon